MLSYEHVRKEGEVENMHAFLCNHQLHFMFVLKIQTICVRTKEVLHVSSSKIRLFGGGGEECNVYPTVLLKRAWCLKQGNI